VENVLSCPRLQPALIGWIRIAQVRSQQSSTTGQRTIAFCGPQCETVCHLHENSLSLSSLKRKLETYLFRQRRASLGVTVALLWLRLLLCEALQALLPFLLTYLSVQIFWILIRIWTDTGK